MAQLINVKLSRFDGSPWGFRLQGGKDFGTPLIVQKVNNGSPAEKAGLRAGDAVIKVNSTDMYSLRHKDAQDVIVRAGSNFEMTVQRGGGSTWRPSVSPVTTSIPSPVPSASAGSVSPVTKTSLAAKKQDPHLIGSGHNFSPKPFLNGSGDGTVKSIVNKQYNSPVGIYSEETIAETLSAQAEVLAGGVLGVNFKKNEKNYNAQNSEVFKMVQEADKEPRTPEPVPARTEYYSSVSHAVGGRSTSPRSPTPLSAELGYGPPQFPRQSVGGCPAQQQQQQQQWQPQSQPQQQQSVVRSVAGPAAGGAPGVATGGSANGPSGDGPVFCTKCDRPIVGVFVRIKEKNLHVECFKCSTCGTSLKNVGYYNINNKLYCDIHAKLVARQNAPAGLVPVTVGPGQKAPANTISAALSNMAPLSPSLSNNGTSSPQSFSAPISNNISGPKPFIGSTISNQNYSSTPIINTGSSTLPRSQNQSVTGRFSTLPKPISSPFKGAGSFGGNKGGTFAGSSAPNRGRGILNQAGSGLRVPLCAACNSHVRGPFISALGQIWCPEHFVCANSQCRRGLQDIGFVEEKGQLHCEYCFERFIAPSCNKCNNKIKGDCMRAIGKHFHPECFNCAHCGKLFGNSPFFLEEGLPYCERDWNDLFTTKCFACGFPVEAGDRWVEALNNNYHSQCFNCTMCKTNLEGQSFYAKGGRPFCKNHAR